MGARRAGPIRGVLSTGHARKGVYASYTSDGVFVSLLADPPGVRLYESFGFRASAPASVGMFRRFARGPTERP